MSQQEKIDIIFWITLISAVVTVLAAFGLLGELVGQQSGNTTGQ